MVAAGDTADNSNRANTVASTSSRRNRTTSRLGLHTTQRKVVGLVELVELVALVALVGKGKQPPPADTTKGNKTKGTANSRAGPKAVLQVGTKATKSRG